MDELKRLVRLVVERSNKSSPLINQQDESSLETKLFKLIKQGEVERDEDAALALYGKESLSATYRMLKSRLRKKLFNQLHFLDFPTSKFKAHSVENYQCNVSMLEVQCLLIADEFQIADKLINQVIAMAKADGLTSVMVRALEQKQVVNSAIYSKRAYKEAENELLKYYELLACEREATKLFQLTSLELKSGVSNRNKFLPELLEVISELNVLWEKSQSSRIFDLYHILSIQYLELCGNYKAISDAVEKAEKLLNEGRIHSNWFNHRYNAFIRIYALLRTRQYETGISLAQEYLLLFEPHTVNWFAYMENYLLLALHSKNYELASELMQQSLGNQHIHTIQNAAKERWELYRKYLLMMHTIMPSINVKNLPQGVLTELVMLPKDKAGFNLSLLVLDTIKSFSIQSIDDYESQAERMRKYISKYLRGEKSERPRLLLRLLLLVIKEGLHPIRSKEKGQKLYDKLSQMAPPGDAFAEVEIIPYEHLWELVLKVLEKRVS
ncbi:hypothetical protein DXT99_15230 [Pontibacter diazotrophicus]|uniref:Uncharacterized protein n=1 Tax=Pontibacter diazotrophicus TaxID=1400979 RepID=A0A3D8LA33_9BACT|nr:hypothetical protein [Pontibacter diazotrophicus]RDV14279.1 hypothetical protein DXT99_15230 [Pontibacter diazotrophicus]